MTPEELRAWVSEGNTAILFCPYSNAHLEALGITLEPKTEAATEVTAVPDAPMTRRARRLKFTQSERFQAESANLPVAPLFTGGGAPAVLLVSVGSGRIVLMSDSYPATNRGLPEEDNSLFLLEASAAARPGGEVIFDETTTRLAQGEPGVMAYARRSGLQPLFIELGVLALLGLWHLSTRIAPPVSERALRPPAVPDYVTGRARLYEKASLGGAAVRALSESVRDALQKPDLAPEDLDRGEDLLERAKKLERGRVLKPAELVALAGSIHEFMNEVIWKPGQRFRRGPRTARSRRS